jgi:N utilization substance protein B
MKRRKAREYALQFLFQHEFTGTKPERKDFDDFWQDKPGDPDTKAFAEDLISGTLEHCEELDVAIRAAAEHWVLERMAAVDRTILRFAVYELLHRGDIPSTVTINEAIEIAKKYSAEESAPFINGILDRITRGLTGKRKR